MSTVLVAGVAFTLSQVLLALVLLLRLPVRGLSENLYLLLLIAVVGYLLAPFAGDTSLWWLTALLQTAVPGTFWLFSASVFDDQFRLRGWQVGLVALTVVPPLAGSLWAAADSLQWLLRTAPQVLEFVLLGLTLWVVAQRWQTDLVESRRHLRVWFVGFAGAYILLLVFSREILFPGESWFQAWQYLPLAGVWLLLNTLLLQYRNSGLFGNTLEPRSALPASTGVTQAGVEPALVDAVQAHMQAKLAWQEMGLTIGQLARQLELPEYRLRQTINVGLGFRNFSDFLNSYRVREAAQRLADPGQRSLPVLTIATDAGFRSLSSFNKAFKDAQGITPSEYRRQQVEAAGSP
jgi:AraC-like DNA-binding protein